MDPNSVLKTSLSVQAGPVATVSCLVPSTTEELQLRQNRIEFEINLRFQLNYSFTQYLALDLQSYSDDWFKIKMVEEEYNFFYTSPISKLRFCQRTEVVFKENVVHLLFILSLRAATISSFSSSCLFLSLPNTQK